MSDERHAGGSHPLLPKPGVERSMRRREKDDTISKKRRRKTNKGAANVKPSIVKKRHNQHEHFSKRTLGPAAALAPELEHVTPIPEVWGGGRLRGRKAHRLNL